MTLRISIVVAVMAVMAAAVAIVAVAGEDEEEAVGEARVTLEDLAFLAGSWTSSDGTFEEHWLPPAGGTMAAVSRMVRKGATVLYELSAIETGEDGQLVLRIRHFGPGLVPSPEEADGPLSWPLLESGEGRVVFEEPDRVFPRRVVYRLVTPNSMEVRLEGERDGEPRVITFQFTR